MKQKKLKYSRPMTKRERFDRRRRLMEEEESARRLKESKAAYLESIRQRALSVQNNEEVRALCRDVWSKRHFCSAAVSLTESILKERQAKKELPMP